MRMAVGLGLLAISVFAVTSCTSGDDSGSSTEGNACTVPTERLSLSLISSESCDPAAPSTNNTVQVEGSFEPVTGGFHVVSVQETVELFGLEATIPSGTFVRVSFTCVPQFYGPAGATVVLENIPTFNGAANPTEDGSRLWFAGAVEGLAPLSIPFEITKEKVCVLEEGETAYTSPRSLTLTGEGASVTVAPGAQKDFTEPFGAHAGAYAVHNVNIAEVSSAGGDVWELSNFTISRAD